MKRLLFGRCLPFWILGLAAMLMGCGEMGPARQQVSGTVTFDGKPVPAGQIVFEPDPSGGNQGPAGFAEITDGRYDTEKAGTGTVGGPHAVRITGLDGKPGGAAPVNPLFNTYETKVDLGKAAGCPGLRRSRLGRRRLETEHRTSALAWIIRPIREGKVHARQVGQPDRLAQAGSPA